MTTPIFLPPTGLIDGVNVLFFTPTPYAPTTLRVLLNGQVMALDAIVETNPATGAFTWVDPQPPRGTPGGDPDKLLVFYLDTTTNPEIIEICPLIGYIEDEGVIVGVVEDMLGLTGLVEADGELIGFISC